MLALYGVRFVKNKSPALPGFCSLAPIIISHYLHVSGGNFFHPSSGLLSIVRHDGTLVS
jgi:hypothetical protein